jgi:hypothetical protein
MHTEQMHSAHGVLIPLADTPWVTCAATLQVQAAFGLFDRSAPSGHAKHLNRQLPMFLAICEGFNPYQSVLHPDTRYERIGSRRNKRDAAKHTQAASSYMLYPANITSSDCEVPLSKIQSQIVAEAE